ncbi:S8 family serine peptidase [Flavobacterium sp.]|uniref:S8 family serine peptidase n=1 Tax=Flavobacterium sp. TaxID=239 RepID=UPI0037526DDB
MKNFFLIFFGLFFILTYSQSKKLYIFNVELNDYNNVPKVENVKGVMKYIGNDVKERAFFSKYTIIKFYQTYPSSKVNKSLNMFTFVTQSSNLKKDLLSNFPKKYLRIEDLTDDKIELLNSYPNDYGTTSPVTNLGVNLSLKSFDYINAPKAWDYFPNNKGNVTIGISDGKVNNSDADFGSKVTYLSENYFNPTFDCSNNGNDSRHGTGVGAIAAAQGNNAHGITGVCYDCKILNVPYTLTYNGLLDLANAGVKVINMSWINGYNYDDPSYTQGYVQSQQDIIDQLYNMGVVLVAAAGNNSQFGAQAPNYALYCYPASYNHVISVTVVQSKNPNFADEVTNETWGPTSWYNEDLIALAGSFNAGVFYPWEGTTTNSRVDICGPGYAPSFGNFLLGCSGEYATATSAATPYVTGTVALMQSLNPCLLVDEVEDILQLTSKNIEANPYNLKFVGRLGSGKLETGDAVEFVSEAMSPNGNAIIDGQDFWRFNLDLRHINNKLTISNQILRDKNISNFTSKKIIEIMNSDFKPNSDGFVDLKIDANLVVCNTPQSTPQSKLKKDILNDTTYNTTILYPNPNKGIFTIMLNNNDLKGVSVNVYDVLGKSVYNAVSYETTFDISIPNVPSGIYFVKLTSVNFNEILKLIKE